MNKLIQFSIAAFLFSANLLANESISPADQNIHYEGIKIIKESTNGSIQYKRFTDEIFELSPPKPQKGVTVPWIKAQTTPCVKMLFKTASPSIKLSFKVPDGYEHRGASFGIYQNGKWWKSIDFNKTQRDLELTLRSKTPDKPVAYTIAFPNWSNPFFYGMELDDGHTLLPYIPAKRKIYVAYGDSVSHGTGQKASYQTWPYLLAEKIDYELYSLAVGGASIKLPVIEMFKEFESIDLITIYIGINDAARKTLEQFEEEYDAMLGIMRKYHPNTKIVCVTLHAVPEDKASPHTQIKLIDFRKPVIKVVSRRQADGDENLFLIHGDSITTLDDAMNPGNVHLGIEGAARWAERLHEKINDLL